MTADVELLPLDMPRRFEFTRQEVRALARDYARANVAHATAAKDAEIEALRAEVERLRMGVCGDACLHIAIERDQLKARAERLEEALRHVKQKLDDVVMIRGCHGAFAGTYMIVTEALHPTAAQEAGRE